MPDDLEPLDDELRRRTRAYLAEVHQQAPPSDLEEQVARAVFGTGRGRRIAAVAGTIALVLVCATVTIVALAVHGGGRGGSASAGTTSTANQSLTVMNVDGPEVAVDCWPGGPVFDVGPGETQVLTTEGAPPKPWEVTVTAVATQRVLLRQSVSVGQEIVVGSSGAAVTNLQTSTGPPTPAVVSRQRVLTETMDASSEVLQAARVEAKLTTWSALQTVASPTDPNIQIPPGVSPQEEIWAVAVSGKIQPWSDVSGATFPWGLFVYDAQTGAEQTMIAGPGSAGPQTTWPAFFDALPDLSTSS